MSVQESVSAGVDTPLVDDMGLSDTCPDVCIK